MRLFTATQESTPGNPGTSPTRSDRAIASTGHAAMRGVNTAACCGHGASRDLGPRDGQAVRRRARRGIGPQKGVKARISTKMRPERRSLRQRSSLKHSCKAPANLGRACSPSVRPGPPGPRVCAACLERCLPKLVRMRGRSVDPLRARPALLRPPRTHPCSDPTLWRTRHLPRACARLGSDIPRLVVPDPAGCALHLPRCDPTVAVGVELLE